MDSTLKNAERPVGNLENSRSRSSILDSGKADFLDDLLEACFLEQLVDDVGAPLDADDVNVSAVVKPL